MAKRKKKTADDFTPPPILESTDLPTDPDKHAEYAQLIFHRTVLANPYIPIIKPVLNDDGTYKTDERTGRPMHGRPSPRQVAFLAYLGRDALYGGAAGGGKSDALLMCALQFVEVPGYSAIIFRRTLKMLEKSGGLIPRMLEWMAGKAAKYNHTDRRWTFPSGSTIEFGYIDTKRDFENYQGGNWQCVCFDEAGQMEPEYIRYLYSRLRKPEGSQIPIRMRLASNPGGVGHEYLKRRYVIPGAPEFFVPSLAKDNPGIDVRDYEKSMANLDPILRAQLLAGDWSAYEGGRFKRSWFKEFYAARGHDGNPRYFLQVGKDKFTQSPVFHEYGTLVRDCFTCITVDPACTEDDSNCPTAIGVYAISPERDIIVLEVARRWLDIDDIVPEIAKLCERYRPSWVGIEDAGAFSAVSSQARRHPSIPAVKSIGHESKSKLVRATPAIIRTEAGQVYVPPPERFPWVDDFIGECIRFTGDEENDDFTDQVDQFAHLVRTIDRMGLGGPAIVYRQGDEPKETRQITYLTDRGDGNMQGDDVEIDFRDEPSKNYGGLTGWRK